jgi:hypothetical protein
VPNGIYPVPQFHSNPGHPTIRRPSIALRLRTRWKRNGLDGALARGADPAASTQLSLRLSSSAPPRNARGWRTPS